MPEVLKPDNIEKQAVSYGLAVRNVFVFLVDWRKPMITNRLSQSENSEATAPMLTVVLQSIADIMKTKIIERASDEFGVVAFGTGDAAENEEWPRMRVVRAVERLNAAGIKRMERIAARVEAIAADEDELDQNLQSKTDKLCRFGDATPVQFDKALWAARHQLQPGAKGSNERAIYRLKVIVLTNDEDPTNGRASAHQQCNTQARDLIEMKASIDVMLLSDSTTMEESEEPASRFFDELVAGGDDQHMASMHGSVTRNVSSIEDLIGKFQWRNRSKRALFRTVLTLGDNYKLGVATYMLTTKAKRPSKVDLFVDTNMPVKKITTRTCEQIGKTLKGEDIRYAFKLSCLKVASAKANATDTGKNDGGNQLYGFTMDEVKNMPNIGIPGITLYGFKKKSSFREEQIMRNPSFVYPDETSYSGSKALFTQLLTSMLEKDVIAIACVSSRISSGPRFATLVPEDEILDENGRQEAPAGLYMYLLPFKNDVRTTWRNEMAQDENAEAKEEKMDEKVEPMVVSESPNAPEGIEAAKKIISQLTIKKYHPHMFANLDLQKFYAGLQAEAGVRHNTDDVLESMLDPKIDQMEGRAGDDLRLFKALTLGSEFDGEAAARDFGSKTARNAAQSLERAEKKRLKKMEDVAKWKEKLDLQEFIDRFKRDMLGSFKKNDLVTYLRAHDVSFSSTSKKADVLLLVEQHIKSNYPE